MNIYSNLITKSSTTTTNACLSMLQLGHHQQVQVQVQAQQRRYVLPDQFDDAEDDHNHHHHVHRIAPSIIVQMPLLSVAPPPMVGRKNAGKSEISSSISSSSYLMDVVRADIHEHQQLQAPTIAVGKSTSSSLSSPLNITSFEKSRRPIKKRLISVTSPALFDEPEMTKPTRTPHYTSSKPIIKKKKVASSKTKNKSKSLGVYKRQWFQKYNELVAFQKLKGHCRVPQVYPPSPTLGTWVHNQRRKYKLGCLSSDRIQLLDRIDFQWEVSRGGERVDYPACPKWETMFTKLCAFKNKYGHCEVSSSMIVGNSEDVTPQLCEWVETQRYWYERFVSGSRNISSKQMTKDRAAKLECAGISWATTTSKPERK